jgi:hypothetical protein
VGRLVTPHEKENAVFKFWSRSNRPKQPRPRCALSVECLEQRATPSGGPGPSPIPAPPHGGHHREAEVRQEHQVQIEVQVENQVENEIEHPPEVQVENQAEHAAEPVQAEAPPAGAPYYYL